MTRRFTLTIAALLLLTRCSSTPQAQEQAQAQSTFTVTPMYASDLGLLAVGVIPDATLHDAKRNKDLPISVDYPIYGGPYPVIVFSHGYGGSKSAYEPLVSYWISHGYVVIRPSHADANALREAFDSARLPETTPGRGGRGGREQRPAAAAGIAAVGRSIEDIWEKEREPQWRDRAADVSFVIDSLDELEGRFPELRGKIDHAKVGTAGHSYGAFTTMLVAGMKTFSNPPLSLRDPRVRAAIAMSPQGVSANRGLTADSWRDVTIPILYMTGSQDRGVGKDEDPAWRRTAYVNSPPGDKYFVEIEGANHLSFTGRLGGFVETRPFDDPRQATSGLGGRTSMADTSAARRPTMFVAGRNTLRAIRDTSLAFWDAYLKGDAKGKEYVQKKAASDAMKVETK